MYSIFFEKNKYRKRVMLHIGFIFFEISVFYRYIDIYIYVWVILHTYPHEFSKTFIFAIAFNTPNRKTLYNVTFDNKKKYPTLSIKIENKIIIAMLYMD